MTSSEDRVTDAALLTMGHRPGQAFGSDTVLTAVEHQQVNDSLRRAIAQPTKFFAAYYAALERYAPLFRSVVTPKIDRLAQVVAACGSIPGYRTTLVPMLRGFGSAHRVFGADRLHYAPVGVALLAALSGANEAEWTSETAELWSRIYRVVADAMAAGVADAVTPTTTARLVARRRYNDEISVLSVEMEDEYHVRPGQHATVTARAFGSIAGLFSPVPIGGGRLVEVHVRAVGHGSLSHHLAVGAEIGSELTFTAAVGAGVEQGDRDAVCIAGGTGIGPMSAVAHHLRQAGQRSVELWYGGRVAGDLYALNSILSSGLPVRAMLSRDSAAAAALGVNTGRLGEEATAAVHQDADYYVAGSPRLMRAVLFRLLEAGVPFAQLHYDVTLI